MFRLKFKLRRRIVRRIRRRPVRRASQKSIDLYQEHKEVARALVLARIAHFIEVYRTKHGIEFKPINKVFIKNTRTRWGSCSSKGNLNFSFRLALLAPHLADYIIVHELCHLREFNHSQKFWDLVALEIPEWQAHRHMLKREELR